MTDGITRYAIVHNATSRSQAEAYLPGNYKIVKELWIGGGSKLTPVFVIAGEDNAGWTLTDYIIPRYASGSIQCEEVPRPEPLAGKEEA
jgi:hypothetical protein